MATARVSKVRLTVVLALVSAFATIGLAASGSRPAAADVTATSGSAFGLSARVLGIQAIPPQPVVSGTGSPDFPLESETTLPIGLPGAACPVEPGNVPALNIVEVCAVTVTTQGVENVTDPHLSFVTSTAETAGAAVGGGPNGFLTLSAIEASCTANGEEATGEVVIADLTISGEPLVQAGPIAPNSPAITIPGLAQVFLNEQIPAVDPDTVGVNTITVNAVRIVLLNQANTEIIIGQVRCTATGPDVNNIGDIEIEKVAPANAQDIDFDFTVSCTGFGNAPLTRTFTRTVTGSGSAFVRNIQGSIPGDPPVVCRVTEEPTPGFLDQPAEAVTVLRDTIQTVTFTNVRNPGPTGSVQVVKVAPANAQNVVSTFTITCPGAVGSPFIRPVTGSGTTVAVDGLPVGTVCTAAETPLAGFVVQPDQNFLPVLANATRRVTFTNVRGTVAGPPSGPAGPRGPAGPAGPPGPAQRILARTGATTHSLVTFAGLALFLGSLLTLSGKSPGMLPALARNASRSVRNRSMTSLSSARSSLLRAVRRRNRR